MDLDNAYLHVFYATLQEREVGARWWMDDESLGYSNLMLIKRGAARMVRNGEEIVAHERDLIFYDNGDRRFSENLTDEKIEIYGINFDYCFPDKAGVYKPTDEKLNLPFRTHIDTKESFNLLCERFDEAIKYAEVKSAKNCFIASNILRDMLKLIVKVAGKTRYKYSDIIRVDKVKEYIGINWNCDISLDEMADVAGVSAAFFSSMFKTQTGKTPVEYLSEVRMGKAVQFLQSGKSVAETAKLLGHSDAAYFSRVFKKIYGCSPKAYKM